MNECNVMFMFIATTPAAATTTTVATSKSTFAVLFVTHANSPVNIGQLVNKTKAYSFRPIFAMSVSLLYFRQICLTIRIGYPVLYAFCYYVIDYS